MWIVDVPFSELPSVAAAIEIVDDAVWKDSMDKRDAAAGILIVSSPCVGWGERIVMIEESEGGIVVEV